LVLKTEIIKQYSVEDDGGYRVPASNTGFSASSATSYGQGNRAEHCPDLYEKIMQNAPASISPGVLMNLEVFFHDDTK